jgi:hypothetical protein
MVWCSSFPLVPKLYWVTHLSAQLHCTLPYLPYLLCLPLFSPLCSPLCETLVQMLNKRSREAE